MTAFLYWRTAARACTKPQYKQAFTRAIDECQYSLTLLAGDPTAGNMVRLNGAWAHAERLYKLLPEEGTPAPLGGSPEAARLAA
jgi:hypothetical protein